MDRKALIFTVPRDFELSSGGIDWLKQIQTHCYVISASGLCGSGKTTLLNLLIAYFAGRQSGEQMSYKNRFIVDGFEPTTSDIDMYCVTLHDKTFIILD